MLFLLSYVKSFLTWLVNMFFKRKLKETEGGELVVSGCHKIKISLNGRHPKEVDVRFLDECTTNPCNPVTFDELSYIVSTKQGVYLIIQWDVQGVRTIGWNVKYER